MAFRIIVPKKCEYCGNNFFYEQERWNIIPTPPNPDSNVKSYCNDCFIKCHESGLIKEDYEGQYLYDLREVNIDNILVHKGKLSEEDKKIILDMGEMIMFNND